MNIKERFKRFFTLSRSAEGFTLVELIIVIVILAILASIAIPAYGQYVVASEKGVEQNQMAMYHNALVVACVSENATATDITLDFVSDGATGGTFNSLTGVTTDVEAAKEANIIALFNSMFEPYTFKYHGAAEIKAAILNGIEESDGTSNEPIKVPYGNGYIYMSPEDVAALKGSSFKGIGTGVLMNKVNWVTQFAATDVNSMGLIFGSQDYLNTAFALLGTDVLADLDSLTIQLMEKEKEKGNILTYDQAQDLVKANGAVIMAAQTASSKTPAKIMEFLQSGSKVKENIFAGIGDLGEGKDVSSAEIVTNAALAYGMYTAYAYNSKDPDKIALTEKSDKEDINAILDAYNNDPAFKEYLTTPQAEKDLAGYLGAMNMINSSASDEASVKTLLLNGFADNDLITIIDKQLNPQNYTN